jgi:hypothetical protein
MSKAERISRNRLKQDSVNKINCFQYENAKVVFTEKHIDIVAWIKICSLPIIQADHSTAAHLPARGEGQQPAEIAVINVQKNLEKHVFYLTSKTVVKMKWFCNTNN